MSKVKMFDLDIEASAIAVALLNEHGAQPLCDLLQPDDFFKPEHNALFRGILALHSSGRPTDALSVLSWIESNSGQIQGLPEYVISISDIIPYTGRQEHHARIIKEKSLLRRLDQAGKLISESVQSAKPVHELIDESEQLIYALSSGAAIDEPALVSTCTDQVLNEISAAAEKGNAITGIPSGFAEIDKLTAGWQPGTLNIIAARPAMGKTTIALNFALYAALQGFKTVFFSLEMSNPELVKRLVSSVGRIDGQRIKTGQLADKDWQALTRALGKISSVPLSLDDSAYLTELDVRGRCRRMAAKQGLDLIVIDYLQLLAGTQGENRNQEVDIIARSLKRMAKELNVPVLCLSQLNRSLESRQDKRPMMADLRESGAIEQHSDMVMFVYRDDVYDRRPENPAKGTAEYIIAKQRNGPTGTALLGYEGHYSLFQNLN